MVDFDKLPMWRKKRYYFEDFDRVFSNGTGIENRSEKF
jgi:hypothetical protein